MKKTSKNKNPQKNNIVQSSTISVEQDIVGLITTLVQKLVSLEGKIDSILSRLPEKQAVISQQQVFRPQPVQNTVVQQHKDKRPMFQVICADCGKNCEVPFKPSLGRAVYCKECFAKRKSNNKVMPKPEVKPVVPVSVSQPVVEKSKAIKFATVPVTKKTLPAKQKISTKKIIKKKSSKK